jgi:hypothetical protein
LTGRERLKERVQIRFKGSKRFKGSIEKERVQGFKKVQRFNREREGSRVQKRFKGSIREREGSRVQKGSKVL